ncbi:MAG: ribonuclease P protein component [Caldimonas sp.]
MRAADFERVLRLRSRAQSVHFALHHLAGVPSASRKPPKQPANVELSTGCTAMNARSVDDRPVANPESRIAGVAVAGLWLGTVVPKRHARRAVTRSLLKRQMRAAVLVHAGSMAPGLWVVRLRSGFDRTTFSSAASTALAGAARAELDRLLLRCVEPNSTKSAPA